MTRKRHTGAFITGSLIGGVLGAAITLWTTPKSGSELRASMSSGDTTPTDSTHTGGEDRQQFSNPVLSFVERAAAPIVGVELGKLAKDDPDAVSGTPVRTSAADARPPGDATSSFSPREPEHDTATAMGAAEPPVSGTQPVAGEPVRVPGGGQTASSAGGTAPGQPAVNPEEEATHDEDEGSEAHAATTEELTSPTPEYAERLQEEPQDTSAVEGNEAFPDPPRDTPSSR